MYDIRQFKPTLYAVILLGMTGFAIAALQPALWVVATAATIINAVLHSRGTIKPIPGWLANIIAVAAALILVRTALLGAGPKGSEILYIGQGLIWLQLIKLYETHSNRNIAQLLILSLMLMVASAINTASLTFGIILIAYLFLSLYCCLLFHLKSETDEARASMTRPPEEPEAAELKQDQRRLSSSMRRLTMLVSAVSISMAVVVFLLFPRGPGQGMLGNLRFQQSQSLTGFSEQVNFQDIARISQNNAVVGYVKLKKFGEKYYPTSGTLLLRGLTFSTYTGFGTPEGAPWQWRRPGNIEQSSQLTGGRLGTINDQETENEIEQEFHMFPAGSRVLFSLPGMAKIYSERDLRLQYRRADQTMQLTDLPTTDLRYSIWANNQLLDIEQLGLRRNPARQNSYIHPDIKRLALLPEVSGADSNGRPLAELRTGRPAVSQYDEEMAGNIESWLLQNFSYTLDLTTERRLADDEDRIAVFLTEFKKGHCEFFAGAMTLMCQSLGMQARLVTGFKTNEYNDMAGYFTVRQSHAHAWVEVLTQSGWKTFDPTSGTTATPPELSMLDKVKRFFGFLEYSWATSVVAYDRNSRDNMVSALEASISSGAVSGSQWLSDWKPWLEIEPLMPGISVGVTMAVLAVVLLVLVMAVGVFLYERWMLRKKASSIGLDFLPPTDQARMLRQMAFYPEMLKLLARRGISAEPHKTPREFADSLAFLPPKAYGLVRRLTSVFYRIRFGSSDLDEGRLQRVYRSLQDLENQLDQYIKIQQDPKGRRHP